ncbi:hypothetical protein PICMEDRAFT_178047 [Pichia membranifaciens NRRL Y-2026]|uniref:TAFII28-like protein domain-containing protein n=1 Tax=Pichia membranifaciens NRRL Y-2026 TaxID=763406 RepID=A0A1E3NSC8_9ASCO|nr:hypothetical protein PICMEDRAFT_178047 [Pichia membranifaciens NRRL Y-2026]ODQ49035.1 hypothetical protein PICMEDRAFT_178047 [Pichia membranifaciens NRRL Y-2026]
MFCGHHKPLVRPEGLKFIAGMNNKAVKHGNDTLVDGKEVTKKQKVTSELDSVLNTSDLDAFLKDVSVPLVSSTEGTPDLDDMLLGGLPQPNLKEDVAVDRATVLKETNVAKSIKENNIPRTSSTGATVEGGNVYAMNANLSKPKPKKKNYNFTTGKNDGPQATDESGVPLDIVKGREYLHERFDTLRKVNMSELLLQKKREEDEGIQMDEESESESESESDSDSELGTGSDSGEESEEDKEEAEKVPKDFEDLLELFDINPDEMSLDLTINEKRKLLIDSMDDKQLNRYEFFRRTNLNIGGIKKLINSICGVSVPNDFAKLLGGVGKVFVGDIVEMAKQVQREENEARVGQQIRYKLGLRDFEDALKKYHAGTVDQLPRRPQIPPFYETLLQLDTGASLVNIRRRVDTYNNFRVVIPKEDAQLTPDHVREAWRRLRLSGGGSVEPWRRGAGGRGGGLF